jgi:hypothetical protein
MLEELAALEVSEETSALLDAGAEDKATINSGSARSESMDLDNIPEELLAGTLTGSAEELAAATELEGG